MTDLADFLAAVPKAELHVHIEGTIEAPLLFAIGERNGIRLPFETADDILSGQNKGKSDPKQNLDSFIACLDVCRGVLRSGADYEDIAYGFLKRCRRENIVYAEIMFDPQQGMRQGAELEAILEGLISGGRKGAQEFGVAAQWILCFQRDHPAEEALTILQAARPYRDGMVGVGLDNPEPPNFPAAFTPVFAAARQEGYRLTSHCDVNIPGSTAHIRDCVELLGAERIDHGLNAIEDDALTQALIDQDIPLTACPTRYAFEDQVPADGMAMMTGLLERGVKISLNSDDPAQFGSGWLTQTLIEAQRAAGLSRETMIRFLRNAFLSAWLPDDEKAGYLEQFDRFCASFGPEN